MPSKFHLSSQVPLDWLGVALLASVLHSPLIGSEWPHKLGTPRLAAWAWHTSWSWSPAVTKPCSWSSGSWQPSSPSGIPSPPHIRLGSRGGNSVSDRHEEHHKHLDYLQGHPGQLRLSSLHLPGLSPGHPRHALTVSVWVVERGWHVKLLAACTQGWIGGSLVHLVVGTQMTWLLDHVKWANWANKTSPMMCGVGRWSDKWKTNKTNSLFFVLPYLFSSTPPCLHFTALYVHPLWWFSLAEPSVFML